MVVPLKLIAVHKFMDGCTEYLNQNSCYFKESKDPRVVSTYDILKKAFYDVRVLWGG